MIRRALLAVLCAFACALAARAEEPAPPAPAEGLGAPLTAEQFDARTRGKTIAYSENGAPYGVEEYRPGRKVVWAFTASECREGDWYPQGDQICFDYHDGAEAQCWRFYAPPSGLVAEFMGDAPMAPLASLSESADPLNCPGPDVGV